MIGKLRDRVTFERQAAGSDDFGNTATGTWATFTEVYGGFAPESVSERLEAGRLEAAVAGRLMVRSTAKTRAITEADRVVIDGTTYNIRSIVNRDRRNYMLEMTVERGVAA